MSEFENGEKIVEMKSKIELSDGQIVLMHISRTGNSDECIDVILKSRLQPDLSCQLSAEYGDQNQEIQLSCDNYYGEISTEESICRRNVPYINLSSIIPLDWSETREVFRLYKGGGVLLNPRNNFEIYASVPNITFIQPESKQQ